MPYIIYLSINLYLSILSLYNLSISIVIYLIYTLYLSYIISYAISIDYLRLYLLCTLSPILSIREKREKEINKERERRENQVYFYVENFLNSNSFRDGHKKGRQ